MPRLSMTPLNTRLSLRRLRILLSEEGYQVFTPVDSYIESEDDFIAIHREFGHLFMFRAGKNGVEVRRRHDPVPYPNIIAVLRSKIVSNLKQRHFMPAVDFDEWWQWIDPTEFDGFQEALKQSGRKWRLDEKRSVRGRKK